MISTETGNRGDRSPHTRTKTQNLKTKESKAKYSHHPLPHFAPPPHPCKLTDLSISLGNKHVRSRKWESVPLDMKISNWKNKLHSLTSHLFDVALRSFVSGGPVNPELQEVGSELTRHFSIWYVCCIACLGRKLYMVWKRYGVLWWRDTPACL